MHKTQPSTKGQISSTTHVQLLQWLHGKQQQKSPPHPRSVFVRQRKNPKGVREGINDLNAKYIYLIVGEEGG